MADDLTREDRPVRDVLILIALCLAALLPFLNKAVHLDDPVYIWVADQIRQHPLDFYGFSCNWYGVAKPLHEMAKNPPLSSYYLALAQVVIGRGEIALHTANLLLVIAMLLGVYRLGQRLTKRPLIAALLTLFSPVALVSATSLMCDVPMLCLWVWALVFWLRGLDRNDRRFLVAAAFMAGLSALTKYFGISLIPLMLVVGWVHHRRAGKWMTPLLIPIVMLLAYQIWTYHLYHRGQLSDLIGYAQATRGKMGYGLFGRFASSVSFTGGACLGMIPFLALTVRWRGWVLWLVSSVLLVLTIFITECFAPHRFFSPNLDVGYALHITFFTASGVAILLATLAELKQVSSSSVLIVLWVFGTFVFAAFCNWTVNGRSVLPLVPAAALVVCRRLDRRGAPRWKLEISLLIPAVILSFLCAWGDAAHANVARAAAERLAARAGKSDSTVFINGHWGFQYYLQRGGAIPLEAMHFNFHRGDMIATAYNNANVIGLNKPEQWSQTLDRIDVIPFRLVATMNEGRHTGFYSDIYGPLPYRFGNVEPETFDLIRLNHEKFKPRATRPVNP